MNEYEPVPRGPSVVDGLATPVAAVTEAEPAPVPPLAGVQVPFVNHVNVTLPVGLVVNELPVETVAESYTDPPSPIEVTMLLLAALWMSVEVDELALSITNGSQELNAESLCAGSLL